MAPPPSPPRPWRRLTALAVLTAALAGLVAWGAQGSNAQWTPRLGLDLAGGTQIVLTARAESGEQVTQEAITEAVNIIRDRVDSLGVAEAEVAAQGNREIVVSVPGRQSGELLDLVRQTAQLRFRKVLQAGASGGPASGTPGVSSPEGAVGTPDAVVGTPGPEINPVPEGQQGTPGSGGEGPDAQPSLVPQSFVVPVGYAAADAPAPEPGPSVQQPSGAPLPPQTAPDQPPSAPGQDSPADSPPAEVQARFAQLDCSKPEEQAGQADDPDEYLAACDQAGRGKYLLAPAELLGTDVDDANARLATDASGQARSLDDWMVALDLTGEGQRKWADFTTKNVGSQVAVVLDGQVVSAPRIEQPITSGPTQITGDFSRQEASELANILKYGALPLSFDASTVQTVSATLGADQLRAGLIAGALGLALVAIYSLLYYRVLGLVNVFSLAIGAGLIYLVIVAMSNNEAIGLRLTLAGIAGLVIGIGIAADSFIVYFERIRDELREGKSLKLAVEVGWRRARRTILAADFVSFLAAVVLYFLAIGAVRGFAVMLGLTTLIDVLVVFLFTKPVMAVLARRKFFQNGHRLSGLGEAGLMRRSGEPASASGRA